VIGLKVRHAHVLRELLTLDHDRIGHLEAQQTEEVLGTVEVAHRNRDVIEIQDHSLLLGGLCDVWMTGGAEVSFALLPAGP
jgi:hypothetical protein